MNERLGGFYTTTTKTFRAPTEAIKRRADYEYFFNQLKSPTWLKPLWEAGLFRNPPSPVSDGKYISYPFWPESRYLARVAVLEPELVLKIALEIPETENSRVQEDIIDAALQMPASMAAKLGQKIKTWAEFPRLSLLPDKFGSLISHLARGGQGDAALDLARTVLAVIPGEEVEAILPGGTSKWRRDPQGRFDNWHYEQILKENVPDLVKACGKQALVLLCDLLDSAVQSKRSHGGDEDSSDYSYVWRPAIEDHPQNQPYGFATMLVSAVRDTAETLAKSLPARVTELVNSIESYKGSIYQRIGLHLLRLFPDEAISKLKERLLDRDQFDDVGLQHEYVLLLQSQFEKLSSDDQKEILGWIENGPDLIFTGEHETEITPQDPSDEEAKSYLRRWQLERLAPLRDILPEQWKKRYEDGVREFGQPKHPEFAAYITSGSGPTSPKTAAELRSMSVDEIVNFLTNWQPPKDLWNHSPEGLGRELTSVVALEPQRFAKEIQQFKNAGPYAATYIRNILRGLLEATAQKSIFSWPPVLDLCDWIVHQPRQVSVEQSGHLDHDLHWGCSRKTIADLLERGFQEGLNEIPFDLRKQVWKILEPITDDPEPTPDYEQKYGGSNMDPATMSINTARGEGIQAAVLYGLWIRRHIEKEPDANSRLSRGFEAMPEVRKVLDAHLVRDPSLAIRSVYGRFFPWLFLLDPSWAQTNITKIFPTDDSLRPFYDAAWNTYIVFCQPFNDVFEALKPVYARAINHLENQSDAKSQAYGPNHHLATHLVSFYWKGKVELHDEAGLLELFWSKAPPKLRGYLFEYVGRSLSNTTGDISTEIIDRLKHLWENRLARAKTSSHPEQYKEELAGFSWCFIAGKFNDEWAIDQLTEVLRLVNKIDDPRFVVERLAVLASEHPGSSLECLRLIVGSELESWEIYSWRKDAKDILQIAIQSADANARDAAINLVHRLGAMGYREFRDVLQN